MGGEIIWDKIAISEYQKGKGSIFTFPFENAILIFYPKSLLIIDKEGKGKPISYKLEDIVGIKLKKGEGLKKVE